MDRKWEMIKKKISYVRERKIAKVKLRNRIRIIWIMILPRLKNFETNKMCVQNLKTLIRIRMKIKHDKELHKETSFMDQCLPLWVSLFDDNFLFKLVFGSGYHWLIRSNIAVLRSRLQNFSMSSALNFLTLTVSWKFPKNLSSSLFDLAW